MRTISPAAPSALEASGRASTLVWRFTRASLPRLALALVGVFVSRAAALVLPMSLKVVIDDVLGHGRTSRLLPMVAAVCAATAVQALASYGASRLASIEGLRIVTELRKSVQRHLLALPIAFFDNRQSGTLARHVLEDTQGVRTLVGITLVEFTGAVLTALLCVIVLIRIDAALASVALVGVVAVAVITRRVQRLKPLFRESVRISGELTGRLVQSIAGIRVVKGFGAEAVEAEQMAKGFERLRKAVDEATAMQARSNSWTTISLSVLTAAVIYVGARRVLAHAMTVGDVVSFMSVLNMVVAPSIQLPGLLATIAEASAGLARVQDLLAEPDESANPARVHTFERLHGDVTFENVSFRYGSGPLVLHDVTFAMAPGTATALVGPSGAGKSTAAALLAGFYEPITGRVTVDGRDLATVSLDSYRNQMGVVAQDGVLFDGTIRQNVAFGRPQASEKAIMQACRMAHVDEFVEQLTNGYDTVIGERGVKLSGGQRQRVAIARALLADPRILILDEATSSLDPASEAAVQDALAALLPTRTTLIIAHRLSTVERADCILVLDRGRIIERGTHRSLEAARGSYFALRQRFYGAATVSPA